MGSTSDVCFFGIAAKVNRFEMLTIRNGGSFATPKFDTYTYTNACGTSSASVVIQVYGKGSCDSLNGVQEIGINPGGLTINPNPSTGVYNMTLSTPGRHIAVRVTDLLGNTLMETAYEDAAAWSIDLHGQASGVYMVTVTVDGVSYFGKLVLW